jgi:hypothetical protein
MRSPKQDTCSTPEPDSVQQYDKIAGPPSSSALTSGEICVCTHSVEKFVSAEVMKIEDIAIMVVLKNSILSACALTGLSQYLFLPPPCHEHVHQSHAMLWWWRFNSELCCGAPFSVLHATTAINPT